MKIKITHLFISGLILLVIFISSGCMSKKNIIKEGPKSYWTKKEPPIDYQNFFPTDSAQRNSIWNRLNMSFRYSNKKYNEGATVRLNRIEPKKISFYLIENEHPIDSLILKGKIQGDYFSVKRRMKIIGLPLIYFKFYKAKIYIGFSKEGALLIKSCETKIGNILFMTGGNSEIISTPYKKRKISF